MATAKVHIDGLDEILNELNFMEEAIAETAKTALTTELNKIQTKMEANRASMLPNSTRIKEGLGTHVTVGVGYIVGSVGVFDIAKHQQERASKTKSRLDKGEFKLRQVTAPMLALWAEGGVRPHSTASGVRMAHEGSGTKGRGDQGGQRQHGGLSPKPFMSQAMDASSAEMFKNIYKELSLRLKAT